MCGIAGMQGRVDRALLERMQASIRHRGPDSEGLYAAPERGIGLAHTRLSILDLSPQGAQPMASDCGGVHIVYNGETYNSPALRDELESDGVTFRGRSDTEVILRLYLRDGESFLKRLNGIFALGIWDDRCQELLVARDGLGVKPLYFAEVAGRFLFGSELKALLQDPSVDRSIDPRAVCSHLGYGWATAPFTMLRSVQKLEPGHALVVKDGRVARRSCFYDLPYGPIEPPPSLEGCIDETRAQLQAAVQRQLLSDVPVGAFLSGGLDSSAVVALARRAQRQGEDLPCFTIELDHSAIAGEGFADDLPYARRVAEHLGVPLHTIRVGAEVVDDLDLLVYHLDEPEADAAPLNVLYISRLAREHGIKVLLSGAGGDDVFTGYRRHYALGLERYWAWLPRPLRAVMAGVARALPQRGPVLRRVAKAFSHADLSSEERLVSYFWWMRPEQARGLFLPGVQDELSSFDLAQPLLDSLARLPADTDPLQKMLYLEAKHFLADHNLNYTDKMAMAEGVEVRVPLLDHRLVEHCARIPVGWKQRGREGKWIFKRAMEELLPRDVIYRPKTGFGAPVRRWIRHELRDLVGDLLGEASVKRRGLFDPAQVQTMLDDNQSGRFDLSYPIFGMLVLEMWCRGFIDQVPSPPRGRPG